MPQNNLDLKNSSLMHLLVADGDDLHQNSYEAVSVRDVLMRPVTQSDFKKLVDLIHTFTSAGRKTE